MTIREIQADHYRIPLPVALSDSTHGIIEGFELVTVRLRDGDGAEGVGYTYTVGTGGAAVHALIARDLAPRCRPRGGGHRGALADHVVGAPLRRPRRAQALAISAVDIALWDLRARRQERRSGARSAASTRGCRATRAASTSSSRSTPCCARPTTTWPAASARSR